MLVDYICFIQLAYYFYPAFTSESFDLHLLLHTVKYSSPFYFHPFTLDVSKQIVRKNIQEIFIDKLLFFTRKNSQFTETKTDILPRYIHVMGNVDIFLTFRIIAHFLKILIRVLSCLLQCKITYTFYFCSTYIET